MDLTKFDFNSVPPDVITAAKSRTELLENVIVALKDIQGGPSHHKALFLVTLSRFLPFSDAPAC